MVRSALSPCNAMAHHSVARRATQRRKSARRMAKSSLKHFIRHKARWMLEQAGRQFPELEMVCDEARCSLTRTRKQLLQFLGVPACNLCGNAQTDRHEASASEPGTDLPSCLDQF